MADKEKPIEIPETTVTVKFWAVVIVIICIFGYFFAANSSYDSRLTRLEVKFENINDKLMDIRLDTKEIKQAIVDHVKSGK